MEKRLLGLGAPDLANLRAGREALRAHLGYIEQLLQDARLAGRPPAVSLADFAAAAHLSVHRLFRRHALARLPGGARPGT